MFFLKHRIILSVFILFIVHKNIFAQSRCFFSAGIDAVYYNGDLRDSRFLPPLKIVHPGFDINIGYNVSKHFDLTLNYFKTKLSCGDSLADEKDNLLRNQNFQSNADELNLMLRYKFFRIDKQFPFNPYLMAGYGELFFNPQGNYNGTWYDLQPLGTEGQFIINSKDSTYPKPEPYKLHVQVLPVGIGLMMRLTDCIKIKTELVQHFTFTDYLDDTSQKYPDSTELSATPNGSNAVIFSSRRLEGFPKYRRLRGNSSRNDNYVTVSVGIVYQPKRQKSHEYRKPNIFSRLFLGKKGWWGNKGNGLK